MEQMNMEHPFKPEYLFRPSQILRRLSFTPSRTATALSLPWHCTISACSAEVIGRSIATHGVYDLPLTEALTRLADPGETALDLGANIGYASLVLARAVGPTGRVICFEPNPALLPLLRANVQNWSSLPVAAIQLEAVAVSDENGPGVLGYPDEYAHNQGVASLEVATDGVAVSKRRLDSFGITSVGVMKLDVEGHEASVLNGAESLLAGRRIRDILFEEHEAYPARSHQILLGHGYHIFRLTRSTFRPLLLPPEEQSRQAFLPPNFLATLDPLRASSRFAAWGWSALSAKPPRN
jgi:FkbM family methyltransferase